MSYVTCHMSRVTCFGSRVTCPFFILFLFNFGQSGEAYWWRVSYQWGLPLFVFLAEGEFLSLRCAESQPMAEQCSRRFYDHLLPKKKKFLLGLCRAAGAGQVRAGIVFVLAAFKYVQGATVAVMIFCTWFF